MAASKSFVSNLRCVVCKEEVTPGTAIAMADADFNTRIYAPEITLELPVDDENSKFGTGDHGEDESIPGTRSASVKLSTKISWGGAVATEPAWWKLLKGCGLVKKTYTTTGIAVQPKAAGDDTTLTMWVIDIIRGAAPSAIAYKLAGCMGDGSIFCDGIGKPWMLETTFKGKLTAIAPITAGADQFVLTGADTNLPETLCGNAVTMSAKTKKITSFKLAFGNDVQPQYNQGDASCIDFYGIVSRRPRLTMNPLMVTMSGDTDSHDPLTDFQAVTTGTGSIVGTHHTLNIPRHQILTMAQAVREGLVGWDMNYKLLRNGSADAVLDAEVTWELLQGARA
jgi:hypothetical protein